MPGIEDKNGAAATLAEMLKMDLSTADWPREENVVEATFIKKLPRKAYFDMGRFGTGIVFGVELQNAKEAVRNLKPGDKLQAKIVALDG